MLKKIGALSNYNSGDRMEERVDPVEKGNGEEFSRWSYKGNGAAPQDL
jgi:hypothetical protein